MTDVILVVNAGSSSIKFSMFAVDGRVQSLALRYRGEIEGIGSDPRFSVADADGRRVVNQAVVGPRVGGGGHEAALSVLLEWLAGHTDQLRVVAVGHRVVHGGEQVALVGVNSVRTAIPSETAVLELRVRALYALNHRYQAVMGLDPSWDRGNGLYRLTHRDLDPLMDRVSDVLALTPDERALFVASLDRLTGAAAARSNGLLDYERANALAIEMRARGTGRGAPATKTVGGSPPSAPPTSIAKSEPGGLGDVLSIWMIAPLIFLFVLLARPTGWSERKSAWPAIS